MPTGRELVLRSAANSAPTYEFEYASFFEQDETIFEYWYLPSTDSSTDYSAHVPASEDLAALVKRAAEGHQIVLYSKEDVQSLKAKFGKIKNVIFVTNVEGNIKIHSGDKFDKIDNEKGAEKRLLATIFMVVMYRRGKPADRVMSIGEAWAKNKLAKSCVKTGSRIGTKKDGAERAPDGVLVGEFSLRVKIDFVVGVSKQ